MPPHGVRTFADAKADGESATAAADTADTASNGGAAHLQVSELPSSSGSRRTWGGEGMPDVTSIAW